MNFVIDPLTVESLRLDGRASIGALFLDYLFAGNRLFELTWVIRSMKREEKNGGPVRGRLHIKTTQILPFFCRIPVF